MRGVRIAKITMTRQIHHYALASVMLGLCLGISACHKAKAPETSFPRANVDVVQVTPRDVPAVFEYVGQTESSQQVEIRARVNGFLDRRVYQEGSMVHQGDVMFLMDRKPFQASLDAAQAEYAQQKARLDTAQANLNRVRPLAAKNALSQKDLDDSIGQQQAAAAALEAAGANVTNAKLNLGYTTITAPVTGLSSFAKKQDGSYIDGGNSLLTYVAKLDPMWVNFSLSENEMLNVQSQMRNGTIRLPELGKLDAVIVLADGSIYPARGHISFTDASLSKETGTYLIRAVLANTTGTLRPGEFVRVRLLGALRPNAIAVPQNAVQQGPRGAFVWTVDNNSKAQQRSVETGDWNGQDWVIKSGLHTGERVIVDDTLRLMPGAPVNAHLVAAPAPGANPEGPDTVASPKSASGAPAVGG